MPHPLKFPEHKMAKVRTKMAALMKAVPDDAAAMEKLAHLFWPDGARCPYCGHETKKKNCAKNNPNPRSYCPHCKSNINTKSMTRFRYTQTPIHKWLYMVQFLVLSKGEITIRQLSEELGMTEVTATKMRKYLRRNFTDGEMEELVRAATKKRRSPDARLQKLLSRDANKGNTFYAPKKPAGRTRSGRPPLVAEPLLKEARRSAKALAKAVPDDHTFFERLGPVIWPKKATCPYCGGPADKWGADKGKRNPMSYCESCKRVFNTKSMTVFRCSHTQVSKWLYAMQYIARTKGRISARQLHIELDLAYGTAKKLKEEIKEYFTDAQMRQVTEAAAQKKPNLTPARRTQLRKLLQRNPAEIRSQGSHPAKNRQNPPQKKPTAFDRRKP